MSAALDHLIKHSPSLYQSWQVTDKSIAASMAWNINDLLSFPAVKETNIKMEKCTSQHDSVKKRKAIRNGTAEGLLQQREKFSEWRVWSDLLQLQSPYFSPWLAKEDSSLLRWYHDN